MSGLLTARFLLHLRMWEDKHSRRRSVEQRGSTTALQFTTILENYFDDFGSDPMYCEEHGYPDS
jgi:hypothetical protein